MYSYTDRLRAVGSCPAAWCSSGAGRAFRTKPEIPFFQSPKSLKSFDDEQSMVRMDEGVSSATNVSDIVLSEMAILAASIAEAAERVLGGLQVNEAAMVRDLELTQGLIMSEAAMMQLSPMIGRHKGHHLLYEAAQDTATCGTPFVDTMGNALKSVGLADVRLDLSPSAYLGEISEIIRDGTIDAASASDGEDQNLEPVRSTSSR